MNAQAGAGAIDLAEEVSLREVDKVPGSGVLKDHGAGVRATLRDLATPMTIVSDNTATDLLFSRVGGADGITLTLRDLGLTNTTVRWHCRILLNLAVGLPPDFRRAAAPHETRDRLRAGRFDHEAPAVASGPEGNCSTAHDMTELLERLELVSPEASAEMIDMLRRQQLNERIPLLLPRPVQVAHKTGTLGTTRNDVGTIYLPNGEPII